MMTTPLTHLAIIMDGNRRWAKERGLPPLEGHRVGHNVLKDVVRWCIDRQISVLSVFAFSTENWNRTQEEVGYLMDLFERVLSQDLSHFHKHGVRLRILGERKGLRPSILRAIESAERETVLNTQLTLCICLNYGGRLEIIQACRKIIEDGLHPEEITEEALTARMYWPEMPAPSMVLRTSGEERLSGFLTWESTYSELYWSKKYWPDFDREEFDHVLEVYATRQRRFGK